MKVKKMKVKIIEPVYFDGFLDGYVKTTSGYKKIRDVAFVDRVNNTVEIKNLLDEGRKELRDWIKQQTYETDKVTWVNGKPVHRKQTKNIFEEI